MFIKKISSNILNNVIDSVKRNTKSSKIYQDLLDQQYYIVYSYDEVLKRVIYEATRKVPNNQQDYMKFELDASGELTSYNNFDFPLVYFIYTKESNYTNEDYKQKYPTIYDEAISLSMMNKKEIKDLVSKRKEFLNYFSDIIENNINEEEDDTQEVKLELYIERSYSNQFNLKLKIGKGKYYQVGNIETFLQDIKTGVIKKYGKDLTLTLKEENFIEDSQKIIRILQKVHNLSFGSTFMINSEDLMRMILALKGNYVYIDQDDYYVEEDVLDGSITLNEKGDLEIFPTKQDHLIVEGKNAFIYQNGSITLYEFPNLFIGKIYAYALNNDLDDVKDLFIEKVLPHIQQKVTISEEFKKVIDQVAVKIKYFIDFQNGKLLLKTAYFQNNMEKNEIEFENDLASKNKIKAFKLELRNLNLKENGEISDDDIVGSILKSDLSTLKQYCTVLLSEDLKKIHIGSLGNFSIDVTHQNKLIDLSFHSDDYSLDEIRQILSAYKYKKKFILLKDNFISLEDSPSLKLLSSLEDEYKVDDDLIRKDLPFYQIISLNSIQDEHVHIHQDDEVKQVIQDIAHYKKNDSSNMIEGLRVYQKEAYLWMKTLYKYNFSGVLADDMGLGKTLEMIAFIHSIQTLKPILIVTPKTLLFNWKSEFEKWDNTQIIQIINGFKEDRNAIIQGISNHEKKIFITSYDALRNDVEQYQNKEFEFMVLDEAQYIKNAYALKTKAVKEIKANFRFVLTGTPIENSLSDLWSIFDFLMPGYLHSYDKFKTQYENLIANDDETAKNRLMSKISPFVLRRTKDMVLKDLPPKIITNFTISMNDTQRDLYEAYIAKVKLSLKEDHMNKIAILALLTRLRQICVDPSMFIENYEEVSEKLQTCVNLVKENIENGHKIVIFSSFTQALEHLKKLLEEELVDSYYLYGKTPAEERIKMANDFNTLNDIKVMLVSLKAGGTGLNLIGADTVIHLDPWWNVAVENQATDRTHRIGQTRKVNVIKLVCYHTIEEKVLNLQKEKSELAKIIQEGDEHILKITEQDIAYLLE